jgi:hypothetical protein
LLELFRVKISFLCKHYQKRVVALGARSIFSAEHFAHQLTQKAEKAATETKKNQNLLCGEQRQRRRFTRNIRSKAVLV